VKQALTAVRLAQRAGAGELANQELREAERSLELTLDFSRRGEDSDEIDALAQETLRLAVSARRVALARTSQNARFD
jgi:hypothetical protein